MTMPLRYLEQTWRWFGPDDPVTLRDARQAGATGIVTALHHIPNGEAWPMEEIWRRKAEIEAAGLRWSVVESVPVHETLKKQTQPDTCRRYLENYRTTLYRLGQAGIKTVCYNFMPVLDWTRTDLAYPLPTGAKALRFDVAQLAAFDVFLLKRKNAEADYPPEVLERARTWSAHASESAQSALIRNILAGLPGAEETYSLEDFRHALAEYAEIGAKELRQHLQHFIAEVAPAAAEVGIWLTIHPDDPPFPLFGLPRVVSTGTDLQAVFDACPLPANGLCFCTGSLGAQPDNDLITLWRQYRQRVHFLHLRQVQREADGSFYEANHLEGSTDVWALMREIVEEQQRRDTPIPMRPDHGHCMLDDLGKTHCNPGYTAIGRLRGLAELRGLEMGIARSVFTA